MIVKTTISNKKFLEVKKAFLDKDAKLLKILSPPGVRIKHHKGVRRGSLTKLSVLGSDAAFKVVTYSSKKHKLYFNDILHKGKFFGVKFWSHRHTVNDKITCVEIIDEVHFTTKSRIKDCILLPLFCIYMYTYRKLAYKLHFFLTNGGI